MSFVKKNTKKDASLASVEQPDVLHVHGANIFLAGFNGEYTRRENGALVWQRPEHVYLGIPIRPVEIAFDESVSRWVLHSTDYGGQRFYISTGDSQKAPTGVWPSGITVSDTPPSDVDVFVGTFGAPLLIVSCVLGTVLFVALKALPPLIEAAKTHANDTVPLWAVIGIVFGVVFLIAGSK